MATASVPSQPSPQRPAKPRPVTPRPSRARPTPQPQPRPQPRAVAAVEPARPEPSPSARVLAIRWTARLTGLLVLGILVLFALGQGWPALSPITLALGVMALGFALGWIWEAIGGLIALAGLVFFLAMTIFSSAPVPMGLFPLFFVPAVLLIASDYLAGREADAAAE